MADAFLTEWAANTFADRASTAATAAAAGRVQMGLTRGLAFMIAFGAALGSPQLGAGAQSGSTDDVSVEVASIKPLPAGRIPIVLGRMSFISPGGRFRAPGATAQSMITQAFGVKPQQVITSAAWVATDQFEIQAKTAGELTSARVPGMLRALLKDRFQLQTHVERRPLPVYDLVKSGKGTRLGPGIQTSTVDCDAIRKERASTTTAPPPPPGSAPPKPVCGFNSGRGTLLAGGVTLKQFASYLNDIGGLDRLVVDRTSLDGMFDIDLHWHWVRDPSRPDVDATTATAAAPAAGAPLPDDDTSLFTALKEQLGLRLQPKTDPVDVIVIDHVEHPTPD